MIQRVLLLVLLMTLSGVLRAQIAIGERKQFVENRSLYFPHKYATTSRKSETDSSYSVMLRGEVRPADIYFVFDKQGKCKFQSFQFECDSCCYNLFKYVLTHRRYYGWRTVGPGTYWSKYDSMCMVYDSLKNRVTFSRLDYDRRVYLKLLDQKEQQYKAISVTGR